MLNSAAISIIARALIKYGYSNFQLEILEYCEPSNCIEREQYYLDLLKPEYNILKKAGSKLGSKHSEATIKKISDSLLNNKRSVGGKRSMIPVEVFDNETGIKTVYPSISHAAKALGVLSSTIRSYFSRNIKSPFKGRYTLTKLND
jgi:NUMOD1 domain